MPSAAMVTRFTLLPNAAQGVAWIAVYLTLTHGLPVASTSRPAAPALANPILSSPSENSVASSQVRMSYSGSVRTPPAPSLRTEAPEPAIGTKPSTPPMSLLQL